jgi:xanthine dehydrogenase accessory factor
MRNPDLRFKHILVVIKGAGDLASGVAFRLKRCGFPLVMTELPAPLLVRRAVSFGDAVYSGRTTVEGMAAQQVESAAEAKALAYTETLPVLVDPQTTVIAALQPQVVIDAIMAKKNRGTRISDAPLVIALGPGFTAGQDCDVVVETNRGHFLGRPIYSGQAEADTGKPGQVKDHVKDRVLRAPAAGKVQAEAEIGDIITQGQVIATVAGQVVEAPFDGVLRGLVHGQVEVSPGLKIGDLDPRGAVEHCFAISEKSLAIAGGVLEAILASDLA